eukprot:12797558-Heterocapsa_arctica.AAC.1
MPRLVDFVKSKPIIVEEKANPLDPKTGKRMRCPLCKSRLHLEAECLRKPTDGKHDLQEQGPCNNVRA